MLTALEDLLGSGTYSVAEQFTLPPVPARYRPVPRHLLDSRVGVALSKRFASNGLWNHQALALEKMAEGHNVVIATGTASGKSLVFRSDAFHRVLLEPTRKVLVFYPLKALSADQEIGWREQAGELGLPDSFVGRIDGGVDYTERDQILEQASILLMTPDVCHAWLMSNLPKPQVRRFIKQLSLVIMDEAHTLEGVFGSNFAFLFRRLVCARNALLGAKQRTSALSVVAATATIANPGEHLQRLTGIEFEVVDDDDNGAPQFERRCVHLVSANNDEATLARKLQVQLLQQSRNGGFITFVDSRKAVEALSVASNHALGKLGTQARVMPYRAGFAAEDRTGIEKQLKRGELRGVVSTAALELGIDLPHLEVGINIGVPTTRKAYRQRLGRIGRARSGTFVVIGAANCFTRFGTTFREYHECSVEPSYLYLDNRFMQFAHARCLYDELDAVGASEKRHVPARIDWPERFGQVFEVALPGGNRPREFDAIAQLGADSPQRNYPLRNVGELNFKIGFGSNPDPIGTISLPQALRECYPGATYYHMAIPYRVKSWRTGAFESAIIVKRLPAARVTKPRVQTWINAGITRDELVDGHLRDAELGFIAECQMSITEKVTGFDDGNGFTPYTELRTRDPNLKARTRNFRTTGMLLRIEQPWFRDGGNKRFVAEQIRDLFCREYSVGANDVGVASTNISINVGQGSQTCSECIALFDQTYGSLRLTENAYANFSHLIERLAVAGKSADPDGRAQFSDAVSYLRALDAGLKLATEIVTMENIEGIDSNGLLQVFASGSRVAYREQGALCSEVDIVTPAILPPESKLFYQVACQPKMPGATPAKRWVAAEFLEVIPGEDDWEYAAWNPDTQEYQDAA